MSWARVLGLALGFAADRAFGDPQRGHPVAGFGKAAAALERRTYADSKAAGVLHETLLVGGVVAAGWVAERWVRGSASEGAVRGRRTSGSPPPAPLCGSGCPEPSLLTARPRTARSVFMRSRVAFVAEAALTAAATFAVLGGETLGREAEAVAARLEADDLPGARAQVGRIVGRRTAELSADDVARAAVETVAENTSDAVVAPLWWGGVFGVPGLVAYRAVNTLDAMVGYRSPRYRNFGWAAARVDDLANWIPARLSAALVAVVRPRSAATVWRIVRRDAAQHPSPNAGQVESAFAAALDVRLGGSNTYDGVTEDRGTLGDGAAVRPTDVRRAVRLSRAVGLAGAVVAVLIASRRG